MQEMTLADCYGHAGLSMESTILSLRMEPFETIAANLTKPQILDAVRAYFGLSMKGDTDWLFDPISSADPTFSAIANKREIKIFTMALIAHEVHEEDSEFAALAFLVASAFGKRKPEVYPQFVNIIDAAARDLMTSRRQPLDNSQIRVRGVNKDLAGSEEALVAQNDFATLNQVLKTLNTDSHEMVKHLAQQLSSIIRPMRSETANLREETDMLWWLVGGQGHMIEETYRDMSEGRAAFLIGADLAGLSRPYLGPRASQFLINKALREGRSDGSSNVEIGSLPKCYKLHELSDIAPAETIDQVRDLCSLNNAVARAKDVGSLTVWRTMYKSDGSLPDKTTFDSGELAMQSFRETMLLKALSF